ncbi:hypothetical protein [Pseudomonas cichorii]|uniref:hypothetical protein n=1 Tax=Pseudomonas cichorii TaxID=36746 RepID=UPI001C8A58C4|nr:hypothetical protein [Pseudomonas cichorii]MBX8531397.1 hypothetical protein [Pseudomonas cichorii]MBX8574965.1 hypothetical protein [Pseudomonas cichorii]MBX8590415.1 hypothetical protein [Pseudomonas cichorii]
MAKIARKKLSEEAIENLEGHIPEIAASATSAAYYRTLAAGHTVVQVKGMNVVASDADDNIRVIAEAKPRCKVIVGQAIKVRRLDVSA